MHKWHTVRTPEIYLVDSSSEEELLEEEKEEGCAPDGEESEKSINAGGSCFKSICEYTTKCCLFSVEHKIRQCPVRLCSWRDSFLP